MRLGCLGARKMEQEEGKLSCKGGKSPSQDAGETGGKREAGTLLFHPFNETCPRSPFSINLADTCFKAPNLGHRLNDCASRRETRRRGEAPSWTCLHYKPCCGAGSHAGTSWGEEEEDAHHISD